MAQKLPRCGAGCWRVCAVLPISRAVLWQWGTAIRSACPPVAPPPYRPASPLPQLLAGARCQLDQRNTTGATALYNAASQGHVLVVRHLAAEGANLDAATTNGCTPLYIAANNGFVGEWAPCCRGRSVQR